MVQKAIEQSRSEDRIVVEDVGPLLSAALELMMRHPWPGNVRQLRNLLERMAMLTPHSMLDAPQVRLALDNEMRSRGEPARSFAAVPAPSGPVSGAVRH